jgi:hypothetical protein
MPEGYIFASKVTLIKQERRREKRRREEERNEAVRLKQDLLGRRIRVIGEAVVNSGWRLRHGDDAESPPGSDSESTLESERKTPSESEGWEQIERRRAQQERAEDLNLLQFEEGLRNRGLAKVKMPRDGNCLFSAAAYLLMGGADQHMCMREALMGYIQMHPDHFSLAMEFEPWQTEDDRFDAYVESMRRSGEWGDNR